MGKFINSLNNPNDIKKLKNKELKSLACEVREIISSIASNKEIHFSSNLGVVELTISLLRNFDANKDYIFFDTGHQTYTYKILTDRKDKIMTIKEDGGISGLMNMKESNYDKYSPGHSGNILSIASGIYQKIKKDNYEKNKLYKNDISIVGVVGDSAFVNGLNFEAVNDIAFNKEPIIVVLNDNGMSISKSVGSMTKSLNKIKSMKMHQFIEKATRKIVGYNKCFNIILNTFNFFQWRIYGKNIFENLGYQYIGPVDGHNFKSLNSAFERAKWFAKQGPVIVHVRTKKGKGNKEAENDLYGAYHSLSKNDVKTLGMFATEYLIDLMKTKKDIHVINPAMSKSSNCELIIEKFPNRFNDVGIAEEHALSKASGMSLIGLKPFVYIYSTFLQRCYDQLMHDLSRLNLGCTLLIDRADLSGGEGSSHHGIYDVSMLRTISNTIITSPRNNIQLKELIKISYNHNSKNIFCIRYPKTFNDCINSEFKIEFGCWEWFEQPGSDLAIISYGPIVNDIHKELFVKYNITIINAIFINKYNDKETKKLFSKFKKIIVYERVYGDNGLYDELLKYKEKNELTNIIIPMHYKQQIENGTTQFLDKQNSMDIKSIEKVIKKYI